MSNAVESHKRQDQPKPSSDLSFNDVLKAARWMAGSTIRNNPAKMALISAAQVFGAVGTALGTIAVLFYIRAAASDGTLGRIDIQIESAAEPGTAVMFLSGVVLIIVAAAISIWMSERAIAELALQHAARLRAMILRLLDDPLSENWQDTAGMRRPEIEVQQVFTNRIRSMTVALTSVLSLGPSLAVLAFSIAVALAIDALAALLLFPFVVAFAVISERLNQRIQALTATYEGRQERTRDATAEQLLDMFSQRRTHDQISTTRVVTDDWLFHNRQLESTKLRLLGIANSALLFAVTAAFFIIVRGVENLSIERIIAYIFAIRFAARSGEQILKTLAQVSRRYEDVEAVSRFIGQIDDARRTKRELERLEDVPDELTIRLDGTEARIVPGKPVIVLSGKPVTDEHALALLRVVTEASGYPGLDLSTTSRIMRGKHVAEQHDILGTNQVRIIISDDPDGVTSEGNGEFVFVMHHRPKVLLGAQTRKAADSLGPGLVIQDGAITWVGSIGGAVGADAHIRQLLKTRSRNFIKSTAAKPPAQR